MKIGDHLKESTKEKCQECWFASVMFDEASNIHMNGLLNVFVNIITKEFQVFIIVTGVLLNP